MFSKSTNHPEISDRKRAGFAFKLLVGLLLLAHVGWICVHLNLVAREQINPWKLGGYGMYTMPHYKALTHVFVIHDKSKNGSNSPVIAVSSTTFCLISKFSCMSSVVARQGKNLLSPSWTKTHTYVTDHS